jgi:hypothetical protein
LTPACRAGAGATLKVRKKSVEDEVRKGTG